MGFGFMLLKLGVDISRLNREIRRALNVVNRLFMAHGQEAVVTSTYGGNHSAGSLHYANDAIDIRLPDPPIAGLVNRLRVNLGPDFDIVKESDHIHVEFDPK